MTSVTFFRRLQRVDLREIADFAEALGALTAASASIRLLPFRTVVRTMNIGRAEGERPLTDHAEQAADVRRAVQRAAARLPWPIVCFPQGLAAHWMLRRRGAPSRVHYGLRQSESRLSAHVWVTLGDRVVIGEEGANGHTCVAVFPSPVAAAPCR